MTITGHALILISGYILHKTLIQNLPHIEDQFNHAHHQLTIYFYLPFLILIGAHIEDVAHTYNNPVSNFSFKGGEM